MGEFQQGLLGCFSNCGVCIITFFVPCVTIGRVAEVNGDSCCLHALCFFVPFVNIYQMVTQRGKLRERQGIEGGCLTDLLLVLCCTECVLCQMGAEAEVLKGGMAADQEIQRV